ncbi:hypothetical protein [Bacillus mycoides]|nr:hypothetical protein [Bacillus mycoides]
MSNPKISEETKREMFRFFMKTSIPRIIAEMKENKESQHRKTS